jgi:hypothetical protein
VTCRQSAHDAPVALRLLANFGERDRACADRAFCGYVIIARLSGRDAHSLMRLHQARHKTLGITVVAYNLVKATCQETARETGEDLRMISFKGALDTIVAQTARYRGRQRQPGKIRGI